MCEAQRKLGPSRVAARTAPAATGVLERPVRIADTSAMKLPSKQSVLSSAGVLALASVLTLLAVLQYRWSGEVSEAASARMKSNLQASMMGFRQDLYRELVVVCAAFRPEFGGTRDLKARYAQQYESWSRTATHPELVANIFLLEDAGGKHQTLVRLNQATRQFESADWPSGDDRLLERLSAASSEMALMGGRFAPPENKHAHKGTSAAFAESGRRPLGGPWALEQNIPALIHPLVPLEIERQRNDHTRQAGMAWVFRQAGMAWVVIQLDRKVLGEQLRELTERYFAGPDGLEYQVAVLGGNDRGEVVYSSATDFGKNAGGGADATLDLFGGPPSPPFPGQSILLPGDRTAGSRSPGGADRGRFDPGSGFSRLEPIHYSVQDKDWQLVVKHRKGSLDSVVAGMRRRDLAVSFGILLVLAATMAMILIASQRARRLAKLQMEFVTGVSHELRTPLAVISSAADNIADGVVDSRQQLARYGTVIKKQARQLNNLVEQILLFAATRQNGVHYNLRSLQVKEVIDAALNDTSELLRGAGFTVEQTIEPDLPQVMGDLPALSQCLQNLITNAVKYGGEDRWIGVRACAEEGQDGKQVLIAIEDHGPGIEHADLQHIFEPFYRSPAVRAAQVHGSGLGLPLAKSIAEAMGGGLRAASERGKGSSFILSLRVADETAAVEDATVAVSANSTSDQDA